jgi:hypothetical protein
MAMSANAMNFTRGVFLIALIALLLRFSGAFSQIIRSAGSNYAGLVRGLQGR